MLVMMTDITFRRLRFWRWGSRLRYEGKAEMSTEHAPCA